MSIKISELPAATSVGNNDVLPIVQSGTTKKAAASLIKTSISSTINSSSTNDTAAGSKAVYDYSAPISHSTSATTYGVGTASNYGHCKTINNLTTGSYVAGEALSAYQGKVLDDAKEDVANKTNTIDENSTSTQYPNAEATYQAISTLEGNLSAEISNLQAENEALLNQIPTYTATGTSINVKDSSNLPIKDFALLGNATQDGTPTPDSPIPIQVVTGDNTLKVLGKNLFDIAVQPMIKSPNYYTYSTQNTTIIGNNVLSNTENQIGWCIPVKNGTNVTISYSSLSYTKGSGSNHQFRLRYAFNDTPITDITTSGLDYTNLISTNSDFTRTDAFTIMTSAKYLVLWIGIKSSSTFTLSDLQIEYGSTASTYKAFKSQTQLISLGDIELAKIPNTNIKDRVYKYNGKWYEYHEIGKVIWNGTENWGYNEGNQVFTLADAVNYKLETFTPLSNYYQGQALVTQYNAVNDKAVTFLNSSSNNRALIKNTSLADHNALKTWLSTHNTEVRYALATPTITEITDTTLIQQLENVLAMTTYKNETNGFWEITAGNEEGEMQIEYYQDIATLINDLRTAILSL